jgi:hypothetical protein
LIGRARGHFIQHPPSLAPPPQRPGGSFHSENTIPPP